MANLEPKIIHFEELDSTNTECKRLIEANVIKDPVWVQADYQTAGRGRNEKEWLSDTGNLLISLALPIEFPLSKLPLISCISSLSVYECISELIEDKELLKIKWPNDILYNNAKISGILIENTLTAHKQFSIIGIGINITSSPNIQNFKTTYLNSIVNKSVGLKNIIHLLNKYFFYYLNMIKLNKHRDLIELYKKYSWRYNDQITLVLNSEEYTGTFDDITDDFEILINTDNNVMKFSAGEISFRY